MRFLPRSLYSNLPLQRPGPVLPSEVQDWPIKEGTTGTAWTMQYLKDDQAWESLPEAVVSYSLPEISGQVRLKDCGCAIWVCWRCCGSIQCGYRAAIVQLHHMFEHLMCLQVLYRYNDGMYGLYPQTIGAGGAQLTFEAGVLLETGTFWRYTAKYSGDRSVDRITWERYDLAD